KYRPDVPILALTESEETLRQMSLVWGVNGMLIPEGMGPEDILNEPEKYLYDKPFLTRGSFIVYATGFTKKSGTDDNKLKIYQI
ncbi:MAG TPA: pyruvate kinase alpha/beta domain-containing protein, partial [Ignavibacteriales bacterium]|nr:pyruvate kinase alpha/beta domain-containing protein [Ignavibacteriales bacterium]